MNRREWFNTAGPIALFGGMVGLGAKIAVAPHKDYKHTGHMTPDTPGAADIDFVTLDGRRVEHVVELDDVGGWVRYFGPNLEVEGNHIRTYHGTGVVRVHWRKSP